MDFENQDKEKDNNNSSGSFNSNSTNNSKAFYVNFHTCSYLNLILSVTPSIIYCVQEFMLSLIVKSDLYGII